MERAVRIEFPAAVRTARERITAWREKRQHRHVPMPDALWATAVRLAKVHGINPIADALGLDYARLKRRIVGRNDGTQAKATAPVFVDLGVGTIPEASCCVVELEASGGSKVTVRLPDPGKLDLVALAEVLWRSRP